MRKRCVSCPSFPTHRGRCKRHHLEYERGGNVTARRKRRERIAEGNNAAARARKAARKAGYVQCAACPCKYLASAVDVDHIIPLAHGGTDTDDNIQYLCRPCHKSKTHKDMGYKTLPF
jgi:5-methylcytosine-specific restriction protein A